MGKLRSEDVVGAIESAQASVADARERELAASAKPALSRAEYKLVEARSAYRASRGVDALRAAQEAQFEARQAVALDDLADAFQKLLTEELEQYQKLSAQLQTAETEAEAQRQQAATIQNELIQLTTRLQTLEANYQRELAEALVSKQDAEERARALENDLEANRARAERLNELYNAAKSQQQNAERQVQDIQQRIKDAESAVASAQREAARRAQETQAVKQQAKELASAYSQRIETMQRENEKESALRKARENAQKQHPPSQLGAVDLENAKSAVQSWKRAWDNGDISAHLNAYAANAQGERVNVIQGKEVRRSLSRSSLATEIRGVDRRSWQEVGTATVGAEGINVVAQVAYRKKGAASDSFIFLIRRSFWQKSGSDWRIVRERLQFYNDVPNFAKR
jgi:chromosome segregation ATPase